jgi:hypothetical protein
LQLSFTHGSRHQFNVLAGVVDDTDQRAVYLILVPERDRAPDEIAPIARLACVAHLIF